MPGQRGTQRNLRPEAPARLRGPYGTIIGQTPMNRILAQKAAQVGAAEEAEAPSDFGGLGGLLGSILGFAVGGPPGAAIGGSLGGAAGGMASSPGSPPGTTQVPLPAGSAPGATGMGSAVIGTQPTPEPMGIPDWQQAAGIASKAIGPLLNSLGPQTAAPPVSPSMLPSGAGGPPSMSQWGGYQQPSALPASVPQPLPQTRVSPSLFPGGSNFVPAGGGYAPQAPAPPRQPSMSELPGATYQQPSALPMAARTPFPQAPSGLIPGALANFSVSDFLNPGVQTPDIVQLIQQQILAGMA